MALLLFAASHSLAAEPTYSPRGIGGGGAMSGFSISPFNDLRFVGTDMGTLFRSEDRGRHWVPVSQAEADFDSNLAHAAYVGFSADGKTLFHASGGRSPKRSTDGGIHWADMRMPLLGDEYIRSWAADSRNADFILCLTSRGLLRTTDRGASWARVPGLTGESTGAFIDSGIESGAIYYANTRAIFRSLDGARSFERWHEPAMGIKSFAAGRDARGVTFAFIDTNGADACAWAAFATEASDEAKLATQADCGFVWIQHGDNGAFQRTDKEGGRYVRMAENDSSTVYVTAGEWLREYGTKIWVSRDAGASFRLALHQHNWDREPYAAWPKELLDYSAVSLEIGWNDNAYESFSVNPRDSAEAGGTGYYFLHTTRDFGQTWQSPFTEFADSGERVKGKRWRSVGLEVTSVLKLKFHPTVPTLGYATLADMAGLVTEDGGETWRISRAQYNTNYDYAFDPARPDTVYAASGDSHDFPFGGWGDVLTRVGGLYRSDDRGRSWKRLTPENIQWNRQFLSIAYDAKRHIIYGGTQGTGIVRSLDEGKTWEYINDGLPKSDKIIPQIELDPANGPTNGNVYVVLAGDSPKYSNQKDTGVYFLDVSARQPRWQLLRQTVNKPAEVGDYKLWFYPNSFAVDWSRPARDVIWLADMERNGAWLSSGIWKTTDRGRNWTRMTQFTHTTSVVIDPEDPDRVYAGGGVQLDGTWGHGGALYTTDGGRSWRKNDALPLLANLYGIRPDPNHADQVFYLFFGGGMLYGPKPR